MAGCIEPARLEKEEAQHKRRAAPEYMEVLDHLEVESQSSGALPVLLAPQLSPDPNRAETIGSSEVTPVPAKP